MRSTSTAMATTLTSGQAVTTSDGRPDRFAATGRPSLTSRIDSSWDVRSPMVLRLRPSSVVSTARLVGPWACTQESRALMFARRSSS
jgi:hypothetical protein